MIDTEEPDAYVASMIEAMESGSTAVDKFSSLDAVKQYAGHLQEKEVAFFIDAKGCLKGYRSFGNICDLQYLKVNTDLVGVRPVDLMRRPQT